MTLEAFDLDEAYLDHDLGGVLYQDSRADNCGMEVVRWLEKHPELAAKWEHTQFTVHSHNFPAARLMVQRMRDLGLNVKYWPFGFGSEVRL